MIYRRAAYSPLSWSKGTAQVNRATAENAQDVALAEGLAPLQMWVKHLVDRVIAEEFAAPDLEFAWDADSDADPSATATIATDYVKTGIKSINEVRAELGLPPVAGGEQPKIQTAQGLVPLTANASAPPATPLGAGDKLQRYNPNHYGPGPNGGQFAPRGEGSDSGGGTQVADSGERASDAQVAQDEDAVPLGLPTARVVLAQQVAAGKINQQTADELLAGIAANDAGATARVNAALRGYVGIPNNWTAEPSGGDGGVFYRNPADPQYDTVRIMPGDPERSSPAQQNPYVIDQKSGRFLTKAGTRIQGGDDPAMHLSLQNYRFDKR